MIFLLDSNIISEIRKPRPHGGVAAWFNAIPRKDIGIPAIVIGELQAGAEITRRQDPAKAAELDEWIDRIVQVWQIVDINAAIAREWSKLVERRNRTLFEDAMIAATARVLDLTIVTRNVKHFTQFGAKLLNPFDANPSVPGANPIE